MNVNKKESFKNKDTVIREDISLQKSWTRPTKDIKYRRGEISSGS